MAYQEPYMGERSILIMKKGLFTNEEGITEMTMNEMMIYQKVVYAVLRLSRHSPRGSVCCPFM